MMSRTRALALMLVVIEVLTARALSAQTRAATPPPLPRKVFTDITCASALGAGVKTKRLFCDVVITPTASESVTMKLPPHTGTALLQFDLHNRFDVSTRVLAPVLFARHLATIAILRASGTMIESEAVMGETHTAADAFDRIDSGVPAGGLKSVAPGQPEAIRLTIPAGVPSFGIVGVKLAVTGPTGGTEVFETQGRPIALVSNVRLEYTPIK
jgi:hypothetical protein